MTNDQIINLQVWSAHKEIKNSQRLKIAWAVLNTNEQIDLARRPANEAPAEPARATLEQIRQHLNVMMGSAVPDFDGGNDGDVMGYRIRTGALHKIIGLLSGIGLPVIVPLPYGLRNGVCCGHTAKCRDDRCIYSIKDAAPPTTLPGQSLFKQRLMATGRVTNLDTKGRERPPGAPDSDRAPGDEDTGRKA